GRDSGAARPYAGTADLHAALATDSQRLSFHDLSALEHSHGPTRDRGLFAWLLCPITVGTGVSAGQAASDPVLAAHQLLRHRLYARAGSQTHGHGFLPGQPDEGRGRAGGTEFEPDVRME